MKLFDRLLKKEKEEKDFPPKPKWRPNLPIDLELILDRAKCYTGHKLQLAIFKFGTVVIFPNRVDNFTEQALITLDKIYKSHPDFKPVTMDDENFLIEYSQPAFTIVFKDELEKYWDYIDKNHQDGICHDEVLINGQGQHNVFDKIGKICLFGRSKMFMDAQDPQVILSFEPN
jgi:hypothetical protein